MSCWKLGLYLMQGVLRKPTLHFPVPQLCKRRVIIPNWIDRNVSEGSSIDVDRDAELLSKCIMSLYVLTGMIWNCNPVASDSDLRPQIQLMPSLFQTRGLSLLTILYQQSVLYFPFTQSLNLRQKAPIRPHNIPKLI